MLIKEIKEILEKIENKEKILFDNITIKDFLLTLDKLKSQENLELRAVFNYLSNAIEKEIKAYLEKDSYPIYTLENWFLNYMRTSDIPTVPELLDHFLVGSTGSHKTCFIPLSLVTFNKNTNLIKYEDSYYRLGEIYKEYKQLFPNAYEILKEKLIEKQSKKVKV
jgi:hypothetical protein